LDNHIISIAQNLWSLNQPQKFLGVEIGTRMTVIRLDSGDLFLHSPIRLTDEIKQTLSNLGNIRYVVAPNKFHHLYVGDYVSAFPEAEIFSAPGLKEKRRDLSFHNVLTDGQEYGWTSDITHLFIDGIPLLNEVVFLHHQSKTLILTDLICNLGPEIPFSTKILAKLDGIYMNPAVPRIFRYFGIKDSHKVRKSISTILSWDFDRILISHGNIVESGGKRAFRKAFSWL